MELVIINWSLVMWVDVKGFECRLQVTACGRVRSKDRYVDNWPKGRRLLKGRELKCSTAKAGYKVVDLRMRSGNGKGKGIGITHLLHQLIAITFIPNPKCYDTVNHMDGEKKNNSIENLEWCSQSYNNRHAWSSGFCDNQKKPVISYLDGVGVWYPSMQHPKGCNPSLIHAAMNGKQKTHRGLFWAYCPKIPESSEYQKLLDKQDE